jgi:heme oxygenase-like protein
MPPRSTVAGKESERLRGKIDLVVPELVVLSQKVLVHPRIHEIYPQYLFGCYCVARASVPLMEATRDHALSMDGDPGLVTLAAYLDRHIIEERGHDEWFLEDLEVLGWDRSTVLTRPPPLSVATMVGTQYYWALHYHPVALLAFLIALESNPPSRELIDELIELTGHDSKSFRTLVEHADLDQHHQEELYQLLDELPLTKEQSAVLGLNAMHTVHMTAVSLEELLDGFQVPPLT